MSEKRSGGHARPSDTHRRQPIPLALARGHTKMLSDARLVELQHLATTSIGTKDPGRLRGLAFEQQQLIEELKLIPSYLELLDAEMMQIVQHYREGKILTAVPWHRAIAGGDLHCAHQHHCQL
ncbi:hypothetical protein EPA93_14960 [Ktedonosporobacter rubrisoli]|uniref:Uncharacterized protein n=1 Tax=Ktedonosporobacter rubrisoli TaxID=2509675 RepID=A0A4P6JPL5_KTERU|nr:hypothetical protein [Ktedonosporobacter rubrisoli]QBD77225.1 hypothetical protein EPA93_14960 [Ktedonosporobacter rubrisoli]